MTREEAQSLADVGAAWLLDGTVSPHVKTGIAKLRSALDSQPEQGGEGEKPTGWSLIHHAHGNRKVVEVCVKSDPFCHRFGDIVQITDDDFTLAGPTFRNQVAWSDVRDVWLKASVPNLCPHCMNGDDDA